MRLMGEIRQSIVRCFDGVGQSGYYVRPDGRVQLHIHAEITTDDGKKIALYADGVARFPDGSPVGDLRENVTTTTSEPDYAWVNPLQFWARGTVDIAKGEAHVTGYVV